MGTQANLAFSLMLFLGARRGDAARLGPKNMKDGASRSGSRIALMLGSSRLYLVLRGT